MQNKVRRVSSERQLKRWEEQLHSDGNRVEKLHLSKFIHDKFTTAIESRFIVHNIDKNGLYKLKEK